jgi:hypothetical protein
MKPAMTSTSRLATSTQTAVAPPSGSWLPDRPWARHPADGDFVLCRGHRSGVAAEHSGRACRVGDRADGRAPVFFLHITTGPDNTNNVLALAFGVLIVLLVMGGSLWIMANLNHNMMPMDQIMQM